MPSILHGRIVHRFEFHSLEKKSRERRTKTTTVPTSTSGDKKDTASIYEDEPCLVDISSKHNNQCGFIFYPESKSELHKEYLLSLPKRLLKLACDAARLERKVAIRQYAEVPILESFTTSNCDESRLSTVSSPPSIGYSMIEVYDLEIIPVEVPEMATEAGKCGGNDRSGCNEEKINNLWTLTQFWRKEQLDFQKMKNSRPKYSFVATIDAISPIVALDPSNPFALIEAYDKENTDVTCVVVLHGKQAMLNHAAIHPLDTLVFRDVVYKPWAVHKVLYDDKRNKGLNASTSHGQFVGRVPSHVFVATRVDSVFWNHNNTSIQQAVSLTNTYPSSRFQSQSKRLKESIPPIITPIHLVTSITGKIHGVRTLSVSLEHAKATVIHYLDVVLLNKCTVRTSDSKEGGATNGELATTHPRCRLYLSHFPMPVALQYSLRKGGIFQAYNVHLICSQEKSCFDNEIDNNIMTSYGACLRSTLILLKHTTDVTISSMEEKTQTTKAVLKNESIISSFSTQSREVSDNSLKSQSSVSDSRRFNLQQLGRFGSDTSSKHHSCSDKEYRSDGLPFNFINYGFRRIKRTYAQDLYLEHVQDWEYRGFRTSAYVRIERDYSMKHVPRSWVVNVLMDSNLGHYSTKNKSNDYYNRGNNLISSTTLRTNRGASIRSPYAEFFEHSFCFRTNDDEINMQDPSSMEDRKNTPFQPSALLDLNWIRIASQRYFENYISRLLQSTATSQNVKPVFRLRKGFHGSIRVPLPKLCRKYWKENHTQKEVGDTTGSDGDNNCIYFIGGFVSEVHSPNSSVASIRDGVCQTPVSCDKTYCRANIDDFFMGQFDSVTISCLCLGNLAAGNGKDHKAKDASIPDVRCPESKSISLPALNSRENDLFGNCTLVTISGFLFITAIQIHCREKHRVTTSLSKAQQEIDPEETILNIETCLANQAWLSESFHSNTVMGMLTRCQFHSKMKTDDSHKCCSLTVSSLKQHNSDDIESDNSCLQALELSVSVPQNTARMAKVYELFSIGWSKANLSVRQNTMASSFWVLGDSGRTCAITVGGSEDFFSGSWCSKSRIKITFPTSSLQSNKLGYIRSSCSHDHMDAFFENCCHSDKDAHSNDTFGSNASSQSFGFVCGTKAVSGMLHRRPARRTILRSDVPPPRTIGVLSTTCSSSIPTKTLSDLFELVFQGLRATNSSQRIMNPSLVRRIPNGRFLGVSFCQVQCFCTRCFCSLVGSPSTATDKVTGIQKRKRNDLFDVPSFWHLPRPEEFIMGTSGTHSVKSGVADNSTAALSQHMRLSKFRCPNKDCPRHMFGVKWECSGVLDDGTGQATMYADGDAALTLLGMSAETIQVIEMGVWSMHDGCIQFMKSIPPPKNLREKVIDTLVAQRSDDCKIPSIVDPLRLLSIQDRASYLLERHCRSSIRPRQQLDYYVRCKPLVKKDNATPHLDHTTIDSFFEECSNNTNESSTIYRGQVSSYTIPSLKLELVDCGVIAL